MIGKSQKVRWLVSLTSIQLTEDVLRLGLKFALTLKTTQYIDFVAGIEEALFHAKLPQKHAEEIKVKVYRLFRKTPRPNKNLSPHQDFEGEREDCHPQSR